MDLEFRAVRIILCDKRSLKSNVLDALRKALVVTNIRSMSSKLDSTYLGNAICQIKL